MFNKLVAKVYDPETGLETPVDEIETLDGFVSDDGKHVVRWELAEVAKDQEYECWWCITHQKLYYGGCSK